MPFGLRNAPASFQRSMDIIMSSVRFKCVMIYVEDIIIFSKNADEHLDSLSIVMSSSKTLDYKPSWRSASSYTGRWNTLDK